MVEVAVQVATGERDGPAAVAYPVAVLTHAGVAGVVSAAIVPVPVPIAIAFVVAAAVVVAAVAVDRDIVVVRVVVAAVTVLPVVTVPVVSVAVVERRATRRDERCHREDGEERESCRHMGRRELYLSCRNSAARSHIV